MVWLSKILKMTYNLERKKYLSLDRPANTGYGHELFQQLELRRKKIKPLSLAVALQVDLGQSKSSTSASFYKI